jgi:soluble lytic murein transglycosylase-like protein
MRMKQSLSSKWRFALRLLRLLYRACRSKYTLAWSLLIVLALVFAGRWVGARRNGGALPGGPLPRLSAVFTPEVRFWSPLIYAWATAYNVDPNLIATVIQIESCGDPLAVSNSGAQGLFQVMPFHFQVGENMLEVLTNGRRGMEYLARGLQLAAGNPGLALAGYNGGHGVINRDPSRWPSETQRYYRWGLRIYEDAAQGHDSSPTIQEWLEAGGWRMCQRAASRQHTQQVAAQ